MSLTGEPASSTRERNYWIDNLRATITMLVIAHHAAMAYANFAYFDRNRYISSTSPVVDSSRWAGMDTFINFNDIFFMPLMFLISGLFLFSGLKKKGMRHFLADRFLRLGIPFAVSVTLIIPIAYIPSFFLAYHYFNLNAFIVDYLGNERWPVGPPWFIWLLLAFYCLAALVPLKIYEKASANLAAGPKKTFSLIFIWFVIIAVSLVPLSLWIGRYTWTGIGPFDFQLNRVAFYFVFFLTGATLGTFRWEIQLFTAERLLHKSWLFWTALSLLGFGLVELMTYKGFSAMAGFGVKPLFTNIIFEMVFIASCIFTTLAFLNVFKVFFNQTNRFWKSLSANAYGIFLIHYVFVSWLQFGLLDATIPVFIKALFVFLIASVASWFLVHLARKIKSVAAII